MALVKYNNNSISAVTAAASIPSGAMTLIKTLTASSSATLSFVDGSSDVVLDSTYPIYVFKFIGIHPASYTQFQMNLSTDSGSNYNVTKTTTMFRANHAESGAEALIQYQGSLDLAQSSSDQRISFDLSNLADASLSGTMFLFNPSSTTFVKHFISNVQHMQGDPASTNVYVAGYGNTTSAINAIVFKMNSGNIDAGKIKLYGIKDS